MRKQKISAKVAIISLLAGGMVGLDAQTGAATGSGATGVGGVGRTAPGGGAGSSGIVSAPGTVGGGNVTTGARAGTAVNGVAPGTGTVSPGGLSGASAVTGTQPPAGLNTGAGGNRAIGAGTQSPFAGQQGPAGQQAGTGFGAIANGIAGGATAAGANGASAPIPFLALPGNVQSAFRAQAQNQNLGPVTQVMTPNGPVYTTSVAGPGNTMRQVQVSPTGAILANNGNILTSPLGNTALPLPNSGVSIPGDRNPLANQADRPAGVTGNGFGANGAGTANQVGGLNNGFVVGTGGGFVRTTLPSAVVFSDLPQNLRSGIQTQIGEGNEVAAVTRQMTPNGVAYSVIYDKDGRPATVTVDANGRPVNATAIAARNTNSVESIEMGDLPDKVTAALKAQAPYAEIRFINKEKRANGDAYTIGFKSDDRYTELQIGADGKVFRDSRNTPIVTVAKAELPQAENRMEFSSAPKAIQDAVKAYAGPADVRNIQLTTKDGKTAFDVVFLRDGRRDQVILSKDGTVLDYKENVPPASEAASRKAPAIAIGDLPQQVQETIRRQTEGVNVKEIETHVIGNETVYKVSYQTNGSPVELFVGRDGAMVYPTGAPAASESSSATPAPLPAGEREVIRTVNANASKPDAAGRPAETEVVTVPETRAKGRLSLADLPVPVQSTIKKINGAAVIDSIAPKIRNSAVVYEVNFQRNGKTETMIIGKDGVVQKN